MLGGWSLLQVMGEDGSSRLDVSEVGLGEKQLLHIYRSMLTARILDEWLIRLHRVGRVAFHTPNIGHEAVASIAYALEKQDWIFPSHRDLALLIARGMTLDEIIADYLANVKAVFKARDFLQYANKSLRIMQPPIPMGTNIPPAVGFAMGCKYRKANEVVAVFFGDGASSKGDFHEALNFAGVFKAPIVFFLENNQYAISVHVSRQTAADTLAVRSAAYGFRGVRVDGNDAMAVYLAAREAVERAREGEGPALIELYFYRLGAHSTADDPTKYRTGEEVRKWMEKEPLRRFRAYLTKAGMLTREQDEEMRREIEEEIRRVVEENERQPPPPARKVIIEDVYAEPPWFLEEAEDMPE